MCGLVLLVFHLVSITTIGCLNVFDETSLRQHLRDLIMRDAVEQGKPDDLRLIGGFVRLSFHDCVGTSCDGCINKHLRANAGLEPYIIRLEQYYKEGNLSGVISRADLWALAGSEAIIFATELATCAGCQVVKPPLSFKWGRQDCSSAPWTTEKASFPGPYSGTQETLDFFKNEFGFNTEETVAIMGAHALGEAHRNASGFAGAWTAHNTHFTNSLYKELLDSKHDWAMFNVGSKSEPKWQWVNTEPESLPLMMLSADVSLIKTLKINNDGKVSCRFKSCPPALSTIFYVRLFAKKNTLWIQSFCNAYTKMINKGYTSLQDVTP